MAHQRFSGDGAAVRGAVPAKRNGLPTLPIVLLLIYSLYVGAFILAPLYISSIGDALDDKIPPDIRLVIGGVLLALFLIILLYKLLSGGDPAGRPSPAVRPRTGPAGEGSRFRPVQPRKTPAAPRFKPPTQPPIEPAGRGKGTKPAPGPAKEEQKRTIITYPSEVEGGIYGETFIPVGSSRLVKLRSLVVEPEYLAENQ
ncbi:MAG TPA: hypothetical protein ENK47_03185 [Euryarchaeota archaeon]|nr:MAG: hypothetical protein B6U90_04280 [Thermoplasmatales archaeon ex4484_6]RLF66638.1 MAG: hypothetical protein DRN57_06695 [Thermoplasmata archaeon]HHD15693.1 hypothetical protein [Euryarchaeota archaeon]